MILYTNGCSWTWGGAINFPDEAGINVLLHNSYYTEQRKAGTWPGHLGNLLGAEQVIHQAAGCGSNARIVRTATEWIMNQTPENLSKTVAVIQWTSPFRYEYYNPENYNNAYENDPDRWAKVKSDVCLDRYSLYGDKDLKFSQERLSKYTYQEGFRDVLCYYSALAYLFNKFNVKYFYWVGVSQYTPSKHMQDFLKNNFNIIDESWNGTSKWSTSYDPVSPQDPHPSLLGHKQLANFIYSEINGKL